MTLHGAFAVVIFASAFAIGFTLVLAGLRQQKLARKLNAQADELRDTNWLLQRDFK
jgi:hypothetical protein